MMSRLDKVFLGRWRINNMDDYDRDYLDLIEPAFIQFDRDGSGAFVFGAVTGQLYSSISQAKQSGEIPFPTMGEKVLGGHAVDTVGYDDGLKIKNSNIGGIETTGALLVRNSWGSGWGNSGYGWLPYEFVLKGLAIDWWSLLMNEWIDTKHFGLE